MITKAQHHATATDPFDPRTLALEAYIYLYPLVLMDLTRLQSTNVEQWDGKSAFGPMNTFAHFRQFPPLDFKTVVRPNFDTLYSIAWLDLRREPMIVSTADTAGRYYLLQTLDMWTDTFASPGWRTTGTGPQHHAYCAPDWSGSLPAGVNRVDAPTPVIWIIGRTKTDGPKDYDNVHRLQNQLQATPLSQWGEKPAPVKGTIDPDIDMKTPPMRQVEQMTGEQFFQYAADLFNDHRPHPIDHSQVWRLERLGIAHGQDFDLAQLDQSTRDAIQQTPEVALSLIRDTAANMGAVRNGWQIFTKGVGVYGIDYLQRAAVAMLGLGANQPSDAVYPMLLTDPAGQPLRGDEQYRLHFDADKLPPADAFWSITLYDQDGYPVPNALNRANLSSWMDLAYNADGSLDLHLQSESPGQDQQANWLPTPAHATWNLILRLYAPKPEVARGLWTPPAIRRLTARTAAMSQSLG